MAIYQFETHLTDSREIFLLSGTRWARMAFRGRAKNDSTVSDQLNKYRRYAEEAQRQADKAVSARDKESWLKIAQSWLDMLPKGTYSAEDEFNKTVRDVGTGQEDSGSMN